MINLLFPKEINTVFTHIIELSGKGKTVRVGTLYIKD